MTPNAPLVEPGPELTDEQRARYSRHLLLPEIGEVGQQHHATKVEHWWISLWQADGDGAGSATTDRAAHTHQVDVAPRNEIHRDHNEDARRKGAAPIPPSATPDRAPRR